MPNHAECTTLTFNMLALLTKDYNVFVFSDTVTLKLLVFFFINRSFSQRIHAADIISL